MLKPIKQTRESIRMLETLMLTLPEMIYDGETEDFLEDFALFVEYGGDPDFDEHKLIEIALEKDNVKVVEALVNAGVDIKEREEYVLEGAADNNSYEVLTWLLKHGGNAQIMLKARAYYHNPEVKKRVDPFLPQLKLKDKNQDIKLPKIFKVEKNNSTQSNKFDLTPEKQLSLQHQAYQTQDLSILSPHRRSEILNM
jgi:hypothetical protein